MLGTELIGWFAEVLGKRPDGVQVQPDRGRRIMPDLEVLQHPLSKWCHSKNSFRCDHITNRLPAEPSKPWNVRDSALHLPEGLCSMTHIVRLRFARRAAYSYLRATTGSILAARRAGKKLAHRPTAMTMHRCFRTRVARLGECRKARWSWHAQRRSLLRARWRR